MYVFIGVPYKFGFEKTAESAYDGDIVAKGEPEKLHNDPISGDQVLDELSHFKNKPKFDQEKASKEDVSVYKN